MSGNSSNDAVVYRLRSRLSEEWYTVPVVPCFGALQVPKQGTMLWLIAKLAEAAGASAFERGTA
jgi:hypothetical protein